MQRVLGNTALTFIIIVLSMCAAMFKVQCQDLVNQASLLQKESRAAFNKSQFELAEAKAYKAADIFLSEGLMPGYIESLLFAVDCHQAVGEKEPARKGYRTVIELCNEHLKKGNKIQPVAMLKLAKIYGEEGDQTNTMDLLQKSLLRAEKILNANDPSLIWAYQYLYNRAEKTGDTKQSEAYKKKLKMQ